LGSGRLVGLWSRLLVVEIVKPVRVFEQVLIRFLRWPVGRDHVPAVVDLLDLGLLCDIELIWREHAVAVLFF